MLGDYNVSSKFIKCNKCWLIGEIFDNEEVYACVGAGGVWDIFVLFSQVCCDPKIALKNKISQK